MSRKRASVQEGALVRALTRRREIETELAEIAIFLALYERFGATDTDPAPLPILDSAGVSVNESP